MSGLSWTAPALEDLRAIDRWLSRETNKELAIATLGAIRSRARFLENFPRGGRPMLGEPFRILRVLETPYLIIYRLSDDGVELLRIRHEREDWQVTV